MAAGNRRADNKRGDIYYSCTKVEYVLFIEGRYTREKGGMRRMAKQTDNNNYWVRSRLSLSNSCLGAKTSTKDDASIDRQCAVGDRERQSSSPMIRGCAVCHDKKDMAVMQLLPQAVACQNYITQNIRKIK